MPPRSKSSSSATPRRRAAAKRGARRAAESPRPRVKHDRAPVEHAQAAIGRSAVVGSVINRRKSETEREAILRVCKETKTVEGRPLRETTLRRWVRKFLEFGLDGLVRQHRSDRGRRRVLERLPKRRRITKDAVEQVLRDSLCATHGRAVVAYDDVCAEWPDVPFVRKTVERWVRAWKLENAHLFLRATEGEGRFLDLAGFHLGWSYVLPLETAILDSTQLDLYIRVPDHDDPRGFRVVRVWVSAMSDVGSRAIVTFEVTLHQPTAISMTSLLRRAWCPGENWPGLRHVPLPQRVRVDAGSEHKGAFQEALRVFQLDRLMPKGPPERQSHVERLIKTAFCDQAVRDQLGHSAFNRPAGETDISTRDHARGRHSANREAYRTERDAMDFMTLDELLPHLLAVVVTYNATAHSGLRKQQRNRDAAQRAA